MRNIIESLSTRRNEYLRTNEHNNIVDNIIDIKSISHLIHELLFNNSKCLSIIFKSECFMLIMNETPPTPKRQTYFLPPMQMMMMLIMLTKMFFYFMRSPRRNFLEFLQSFYIFLTCDTVTYICDCFICIKHG